MGVSSGRDTLLLETRGVSSGPFWGLVVSSGRDRLLLETRWGQRNHDFFWVLI